MDGFRNFGFDFYRCFVRSGQSDCLEIYGWWSHEIDTASTSDVGRDTHLILISIILLGKELANIFIQFGQKFYGEKIRINVSSELAQAAIDKILTYRIAYYNDDRHESGKLQIRIDRGIESLTKLVQNFFLDILPLFSTAIIALIVMYMQNLYVGLVSTFVIPIYFYVTSRQAKK